MNIEKLLQTLLANHNSYFWPLTDSDLTEVHLGIYDEVQLHFKYDKETNACCIRKVNFNKGNTTFYMYSTFDSKTKEYSLVKDLINVIQEKFKDEGYRQNHLKNHKESIYKTTEFILDNFPEQYPS